MNAFLAASLFENPWVVVAFVVFSIVSNFLIKRRQSGEEDSSGKGVPPMVPRRPGAEFDLEETFRRLLGEAPPPTQPTPPPIRPHVPTMEETTRAGWHDADEGDSEVPWRTEHSQPRTIAPETKLNPSRMVPQTPPPVRIVEIANVAPSVEERQAAKRFAQLNERGHHPATVVHGGVSASRGTIRPRHWRGRSGARQAFVASLVFGPPKSLET